MQVDTRERERERVSERELGWRCLSIKASMLSGAKDGI